MVGEEIEKIKRYDVKQDDVIVVPKNNLHTIINPTQQPMVIFEVREGAGDIQSRDQDVVRIYDNFARAEPFPQKLTNLLYSPLSFFLAREQKRIFYPIGLQKLLQQADRMMRNDQILLRASL